MIIIAVPSIGMMPTKFVLCLLDLINVFQRNKIQFLINIETGSFLPHVRGLVCGESRDRGIYQQPYNDEKISHILMLDSDIIFSPEDVLKLIKADKDFICGMYCYGTEFDKPVTKRKIVAGFWDEPFFEKHGDFPTLSVENAKVRALGISDKIINVDWVGLGFALAKTKIFKQIEHPWFESEKVIIGSYTDTTSEDVGFCRKLKKHNIPILLHTEVLVGHYKNNIV